MLVKALLPAESSMLSQLLDTSPNWETKLLGPVVEQDGRTIDPSDQLDAQIRLKSSMTGNEHRKHWAPEKGQFGGSFGSCFQR